LSAASGTSPEGGDPNTDLRQVLDVAPTDVKQVVLAALHALSQWQESTERRR
jgi:hypothetical protein